MAAHLFDASALVKHYLNEIGTAWANGIIDPAAGNQILVARLTAVEVVAAIRRRQHSGSITLQEAAQLIATFRSEFVRNFVVEDISAALMGEAMDLADSHGLRGADWSAPQNLVQRLW